MPRTDILIRSLVELADTLVDDFDVVDLLTLLADRCVEALDVSAAGLMLAAADGDLRVVASSSEAMRLVEVFELQAAEGPCWDCYRTGEPVRSGDLATSGSVWPRFTPVALEAGFQTAYAIPMRLRGAVIGALNLFRIERSALSAEDFTAAQALADVATIAILQDRAGREVQRVNEHLSHALNSRIMIEQAKGVLAQRSGVGMEEAFSRLRGYARQHNLLLADVAREVIGGMPLDAADPRPEGLRAAPAGTGDTDQRSPGAP
jgi:GAF domain-containing protein